MSVVLKKGPLDPPSEPPALTSKGPAATAQDSTIFYAALVSSLIGLLFIWDSGYARSAAKGAFVPRELVIQLVSLVVAVLAFFVCKSVKTSAWVKMKWPAIVLCIAGVALVEVFGQTINGAKRWIDFGPVSVQPAEFAKLGVLLFMAGALWDRKPSPKPPRKPKNWAETLDWVWVPRLARGLVLVPVLIVAVMIEQSPDLATATVVLGVAFGAMYLGGVSAGSLRTLVVLVGLAAILMVLFEPYRLERVVKHGDRWTKEVAQGTGYQSTQSESAMARGGWFGVGFGQGRAKHTLPAPTTDFVMTTVAEETGVVGTLGLMGILGYLVHRLISMAKSTSHRFGKLVLGGTACWIGLQACTNLVMANGTWPAIGVPMPFLSYGGSSLVALWAALGICTAFIGKEESNRETGHNRRRNRRSRFSGA